MRTVGAYEAKTHLPKLLERVIRGEQITITKHGVPVAVLGPPDRGKVTDVASVILALRKFRDRQQPVDTASIHDMIEEGRR